MRTGLAISALVAAVIMATFVVGPFTCPVAWGSTRPGWAWPWRSGRVSRRPAAYLGSLIILTAGYSLFQAANNTAVMRDVAAQRRGTVSGLLNLSRNLGLIFGTSALGAVFAWATPDVTHATAQSVANGLHATFAVACGLILFAGMMAWSRNRAVNGLQNLH